MLRIMIAQARAEIEQQLLVRRAMRRPRAGQSVWWRFFGVEQSNPPDFSPSRSPPRGEGHSFDPHQTPLVPGAVRS